MSALEIDDLTVSYGRIGRPAVSAVSMSVAPGEIKVVVGESGSGKSTLGLAAQRLLPSTATVTGSVLVEGRSVLDASPGALREIRGRRIRYVPQEPSASLNPRRTIGSQLVETLKIHHIGSGRTRSQLAAQHLEEVGLADPEQCLRMYPHELSGGMAQRVIIADALLVEPAVIIADEPTASLDATTAVLILTLLRRVARLRNAGVLLITHNIGHAVAIGDTADVMYAGVVVESGDARTVVSSPRMPYTAALLASRPTVAHGRQRLPVIPGGLSAKANRTSGCVFADRCSFADERCRIDPPVTVVAAGGYHRCWHPLPDHAADRMEVAP